MTTHKITYLSAVRDKIFPKEYLFKPTIAVVMPAHNEEESIERTLRSVAKQKIPKGMSLDVYIALDNCTDRTEGKIREVNEELGLRIFMLETRNNEERKVGALNQVYRLFYGDVHHLREKEIGDNQARYVESIQAFVGIDSDVELGDGCLLKLWDELNSAPYIGSVSANYTCQYPEESDKKDKRPGKQLRKNWWVSQQIRDFADWTLRQKQNKHVAEIAGGQCSIFRPQVLLEVREKYKLNGFYDNKTDTEDLLITQNIRACGWNCVISKDSRCFVDSMDTYNTYFAQRKKWVSGTVDYMMMEGLKTAFGRKMWAQEIMLFINMLIRVLLIALLPLSLFTGAFTWNWFWALPFIASSILNVCLTLLSPNYTTSDLVLCLMGFNQEVYLWITIHIHIVVWLSKLKIEQEDGWANQYLAEQGSSRNPFNITPVLLLLLVGGIFYLLRDKWMLNKELTMISKAYMTVGYPLLTFLTIFMTLVVIKKIWKLRHPYRP